MYGVEEEYQDVGNFIHHCYKVRLEGARLSLELELKNTGDKEISFTTALHTYYKVASVEAARVVGLAGLDYVDKCLPDTPTLKEDREEVGLTGSTDRVYRGPAGSLVVKGRDVLSSFIPP